MFDSLIKTDCKINKLMNRPTVDAHGAPSYDEIERLLNSRKSNQDLFLKRNVLKGLMGNSMNLMATPETTISPNTLADDENKLMKTMNGHLRILDENDYLQNRYRALQTDYLYYQNQYQRSLSDSARQDLPGREEEIIQKLKEEKDTLCKLLNQTVSENEELHGKLQQASKTNTYGPSISQRLSQIEPEDKIEECMKEINRMKDQLGEERVKLLDAQIETDKYKKLYEDAIAEKNAVQRAEKQERFKNSSQNGALTEGIVQERISALTSRFDEKENRYIDEKRRLEEHIQTLKGLLTESSKDILDLKKIMSEKDKSIAKLEIEKMDLANKLMSIQSDLDLVGTEKTMNLEAKRNTEKQLDFTKHQIEVLKKSLQEAANRENELKFALDLNQKDKDYARDKEAALQQSLHDTIVDRDSLANQM